MNFRKILFLFFAFFASKHLSAQKDENKFMFYMDYFYSKPTSKNQEKPYYFSSYFDNNFTMINSIIIKYSRNEDFTDGKLRLNIGLIHGAYSYYNMSKEIEIMRSLYESNVGYKPHKNWIIEYGIMPSHIGFESAIGMESSTATRSILADNSPYYESGLRINYNSNNKKFTANLNMLDGWQMMLRQHDNQRTAWGHQITYKPNKKITLNSSSYVGPSPTNYPNTRYFHNFYAQYKKARVELTAGLDQAMECKENTLSEDAKYYFAPIIIAKYTLSQDFSVTGRYEYFSDKNMVLKYLELKQVHGFSINMDYQLDEELLLRLEARYLKHREYPSLNQNDLVNSFISGIICMKITK
jgi:hypothetical protein